MNFVYVIVSSHNDYYLEQLYVSMYSLKHHVPSARIRLITDKLTSSSFSGIRAKEAGLADEIIVADTDDRQSPAYRSRLLKTSVRNIIDGDYLFIDTDTVIVKPFGDELQNMTADISACDDTHSLFKNNPYRKMCIDDCRRIGCRIEAEEHYFNSGVIWVRDSDVARRFYEQWHKNWIDGAAKGVTMDQPAFAKTNCELGRPVAVLPDRYNCELKHGVRYLGEAFVIHYLCTNKTRSEQPFLLNEAAILEEIKRTGTIPAAITDIIGNPYKGISRTTLLLAGNDLMTANSKAFRSLCDIDYNSGCLFAVATVLLRWLRSLSKRTLRLRRLVNPDGR